MLNLSLRDLEVFCTVAKHCSFSKAANELYISQSSISKIIAHIESELSMQLIERDSHHVSLTPAGTYLYPALGDILKKLQITFDKLEFFDYPITVSISLSMPSSMCERIAKSFAILHPNTKFQSTQNYDVYSAFSMLLSKQSTMWITPSTLLANDYLKHLDIIIIHEDPIFVILPKNHRLANTESISLRELCNEQIIVHSPHVQALLHALSVSSGIIMNISDYIRTMPTRSHLFASVYGGAGIGILYQSDLEMMPIEKFALVPLVEGVDNNTVCARLKSCSIEQYEEDFITYLRQNWRPM